MPKKSAAKPPVDETSIRTRLELAMDARLVVTVRRWIRDADDVEGFVVGIGTRWAALAVLDHRVRLDGWTLLRLDDVQAVTVEPDADCFPVRVLCARGQWPPPPTEVPLDDLRVALAVASTEASLTAVHREHRRPDVCHVGSVVGVDGSTLNLLEVDTEGRWHSRARSFDVDDVTRVDYGGDYERALALVAGPPPSTL